MNSPSSISTEKWAAIAAIALTLRSRKETKYQNPSEQLAVKSGDRLKIVKGMTSEAK